MEDQQYQCKNCGNRFTGKFCNNCGEKKFTDHDKSILHFFEEALHFITHFEGTFFTTLGAILSKPGKLSADICSGIRKKYFKPLSFFMVLVVLYLIFPFFTGLNMPFKIYVSEKQYARQMVTKKTGVNIDSLSDAISMNIRSQKFGNEAEFTAYAFSYSDSVIKQIPKLASVEKTYNAKSEKTSKILLLVLIPLTAVVLYALAFFRRKYFYDHLVMATELNSFFLLFTFLIGPLLITIMHKLLPSFMAKHITDEGLGYFFYGVVALFTIFAFRRFYSDKWLIALLKTLIVIVAHWYIVQVLYKFILFVVTLSFSH